MAQSMADANSRFEQATQDIRTITQEIKRDLDVTRAELKQGLNELPTETREATGAMRRVVSEQIDALKELSRVVQRHGNMFDTVPASSSKQRNAPASSNARPLPQAQPQPQQPARQPEPQPQQPPASSYAPQSSRDEHEGRSGGWVSDLLRRASQPEDNIPQPGDAEALAPISKDIIRGIDANNQSDAWESYRRGEGGSFTRRLYTLKGQQTFEDVRMRYQRDTDFRNTVNRYVGDFERILDDISRKDRDGSTTMNYLTSDTGKIYTMLAHASGRLG